MPLINTSIPNFLGGVSQQPAELRFPEQCEEQENALASVVDGLQKRPATQHIATLLADTALDDSAKVHFIERDNDERYVIIIEGDTQKTITGYNLNDGTKSTISQKFRGVVASFEYAGNNAAWGNRSSCKVTFTQDCPIVVPRTSTALLGVVKLVGGGSITTTEYPLLNVADTLPGGDVALAQLASNQIHFQLAADAFELGDPLLEATGIKLFGTGTGELQTVLEYTVLGGANSALVLDAANYLNTTASGHTVPKDDLKLLTTGDVTYVLNTQKTVTKDSSITRPVSNDALCFIKQGDYEKKYGVRVDIEGEDADDTVTGDQPYENWIYSGASQKIEGSTFYNTAKQAQSDYILETLFSNNTGIVLDAGDNQNVNTAVAVGEATNLGLLTSVEPGTWSADIPFTPLASSDETFTTELLSPQLGIIRGPATPAFTVYPVDSTSGAGMGVAHKAVTVIADLPEVAPHRFKIEVQGDIEEATDNRYVQFLVAGSDASTADETIGQGSWAEIGGSEVPNRIDPRTMPLVLRSTAVNTFELAHIPLDELLAGDVDTNPDPSFIGSTINGMFQYKGRLGFLSDASITLTEVKFGSYDSVHGTQSYNFYRTSVTSLLDSDPIDLTVSSSHVVTLKNAIAFQDSLVLFSDFGQFVMRSGDILTSSTVSANPITEFEYDSSVAPLALGSYIYFPFARGKHMGVREFTVNATTDVFDANEITSHIPQYIPQKLNDSTGKGEGLISMTGAGSEELMALTDGTDIYIYKYFYSGAEKVLSSWSKFTLSGGGIRGIGFVDSDLYVVQAHTGATNGQTHLLKMPLENKQRDAEGYNTHLDRRVEVTFNANAAAPSFNVPYLVDSSTETLQAYTKDGLLLQNLVFTENTATGITTVSFADNIVSGGVTGAAVKLYVGTTYNMKYTFSEQLFKTVAGDKMTLTNSGRKLIRNGSLFFTDTSHFVVKVTPYLRATSQSEFNATVVQATTEGSMPLESNSFRFPVFTDPKGTVITIENDSATPCNLQSAEFESFVHQRSRSYG